jgi:hypothetical protein
MTRLEKAREAVDKAQATLDRANKEFSDARLADLNAKPPLERMIFSAHARCHCGAGLAYDPADPGDPGSPFKGPTAWRCADIILFKGLGAERQAAVQAATHDRGFPFATYEIKSENQPSANGATTRPQPV